VGVRVSPGALADEKEKDMAKTQIVTGKKTVEVEVPQVQLTLTSREAVTLFLVIGRTAGNLVPGDYDTCWHIYQALRGSLSNEVVTYAGGRTCVDRGRLLPDYYIPFDVDNAIKGQA
jgi:hypothetical protein